MSNDFYGPLIWTAGKIAEEYGVSAADVLALLLREGKDQARVRQALTDSANSDEARSKQREGKQFDLVEHARLLLQAGKGGERP